MKIVLNGDTISIDKVTNLAEFLEQQEDNPPHFVVAVNEHCIPKKEYSITRIYDGDRIEILVPIQGG